MVTGARRWWRRWRCRGGGAAGGAGGLPSRSGAALPPPLLLPLLLLLLVPLLLLALQLVVVGPRLPRVTRPGEDEQEGGAVAFSVISIEPARSSVQRGASYRGARVEEPGAKEEVYEDENEMLSRQTARRTLEVLPWAAGEPSFSAELDRVITHISSPQLNCSKVLSPGQARASPPTSDSPRWLLCAEDWLLPDAAGTCVAYSFSMNGGDAEFVETAAALGCEVHRFDPSSSDALAGHRGNSLASNHGKRGVASQHKMWPEWRAPRKPRKRGGTDGASRTLADITAALGHRTVDFLYADLLSAEWRVFQNWIESGTLQSIHHLVATVHLQWAGFEVGGTNEEVLRYWFSVLQGLRAAGLKLVHSSAGEGHSVLKQRAANAHSVYTLSWVNTRH
ncbi:putative methyltransferase-like protein 24 [Nelusetta ayraudi]|uniref:putative methyltransferase-like protein 24 n=1 Tax=Nelusetta ayraudi TaxID=303726 RepID=UPI003F6F499B